MEFRRHMGNPFEKRILEENGGTLVGIRVKRIWTEDGHPEIYQPTWGQDDENWC